MSLKALNDPKCLFGDYNYSDPDRYYNFTSD